MAKINFTEKKSFLARVGKRNIILVCAVLIIGLAIYLNYTFFYNPGTADDNPDTSVSTPTDGVQANTPMSAEDAYFKATQLSRQQARDEALEVLKSVLNNENALESTKTQALEDMNRIAAEIETESNIETLVTAKGFEQCIAVINKDKASIVVKSDGELMANQLAQINEIVYSEAGISPSNIKIIKK